MIRSERRRLASDLGVLVLAGQLAALAATSGCMHTVTRTRTVPTYETEQVEVGEREIRGTKKVQVGEEPEYEERDVPPAITIPSARIGVFRFTETTAGGVTGLGAEAAIDIETWLMDAKQAGKVKYEVLGRTQIRSIMAEKELADAARRARKMKSLDYILAGHIGNLSGRYKLVLQCIRVGDTKIVFSHSFRAADLSGTVEMAMDALVSHKELVPTGRSKPVYEEQEGVVGTEPIYETRRVQVGTHEEEYKKRVADSKGIQVVVAVVLLFGISTVLVLAH